MSGGKFCICDVKDRSNFAVLHRWHNHSAFESPKYAEHLGNYSTVQCKVCNMVWHTKAKYVHSLPDAPGSDTDGYLENN